MLGGWPFPDQLEGVVLTDADGRECAAYCHFSRGESGWRINGWISADWHHDGTQVLGPW
jgi:hypothetical protein